MLRSRCSSATFLLGQGIYWYNNPGCRVFPWSTQPVWLSDVLLPNLSRRGVFWLNKYLIRCVRKGHSWRFWRDACSVSAGHLMSAVEFVMQSDFPGEKAQLLDLKGKLILWGIWPHSS